MKRLAITLSIFNSTLQPSLVNVDSKVFLLRNTDQLNVLVPDWTQKVVERIFASHLEDWPALLKSLRSVGDEIRTQSNKTTVIKAGSE